MDGSRGGGDRDRGGAGRAGRQPGELVMLLGSGRLPEETLSSWDEVCLVILVFGRGESVEVVVVLGSSFGLLVEAVMASKKRHSLDYYSFDWTYRAQI